MSDTTPTKIAPPAISLLLEQPTAVLIRESGETKPILDLTDVELAAALGKAKLLKELLLAKIDDLGIEALNRMDRAARWTNDDVAGIRVEGGSPKTGIDYSPEGLKANLDKLVESGDVSEEARDAAVSYETPSPVLKVRKKGLEALAKLEDDAIDAAIKDARKPKKRSVKVTLEDPESIR